MSKAVPEFPRMPSSAAAISPPRRYVQVADQRVEWLASPLPYQNEGLGVLEVEMKLEVAPDAVAALRASAILADEPECKRLRAVYYDTPDHALADAGFSLRIRTCDDVRIQTVKAGGAASAGLFVRSEWEMAVDDDTPVLDHTTPIKAKLGPLVDEVGPLFDVTVERCTWNVQEGDSMIELVLDQGQIHGDGRDEAICEIELELKDGVPADLFRLAHKLDAVVPVRIGVLSKSERGYRLGRPLKQGFKAEPIALDATMDVTTAFQHVAQICLRQFRLNEQVLLEHRSPKALHQARVALRRLRSAFSIFADSFEGDAKAAALRDDLRGLAAILGEARNLDVLIGRASAGALHDRLQGARDEAYTAVEMALASPKTRTLMLDLMEWLVDGAWVSDSQTEPQRSEPIEAFAGHALDRYRRKVKKGGRRLAKADDETRHDLRKNAKKLRYASEFFAALFDDKKGRRRYKRFIAALGDLQDQLGLLNDLATAPDEIRKLGAEDDPEAQALLGSEAKKPLLAAAAEAHEALVDTKRFWR
jgi:inorganic triphosphatase YgiF